eukprot:1315713-Amphidinium_carterae.1
METLRRTRLWTCEELAFLFKRKTCSSATSECHKTHSERCRHRCGLHFLRTAGHKASSNIKGASRRSTSEPIIDDLGL